MRSLLLDASDKELSKSLTSTSVSGPASLVVKGRTPLVETEEDQEASWQDISSAQGYLCPAER